MATNITNVTKYPGNYKLYVSPDGLLYTQSGSGGTENKSLAFIKNDAGSYILNKSVSYMENDIGTYISNKANDYMSNEIGGYLTFDVGSYVENTIGDYLLTDVGSYIENISGSYIRNQSGGYNENVVGDYLSYDVSSYVQMLVGSYVDNQISSYLQNQVGSYVENTIGDYLLNDVSSYIQNQVGSYVTTDAGGYIENIAGGYIQDTAGDYIKLDAGTNIDMVAGGDLTGAGTNISFTATTKFFVDAITLQLGTDRTQEIDTQGSFVNDLIPLTSATFSLGTDTRTWKTLYTENVKSYNPANVGNPYFRVYDPLDVYGATPGNLVQIAAANAQREASENFFRGGVGIQKDLNVGGFIYGRIESANTSLSVSVTSTNVDQTFYPTFAVSTGNAFLLIDTIGQKNGLSYNPSQGLLATDRAGIFSTDNSVSTTTGAFTVTGGVGIGRDIVIGGNVLPGTANSSTVGTIDKTWASAFLDNVYSQLITNTASNITIDPGLGLTDIIGNIRVRGNNPIGTAPVVTNTLYVTMDGSDTNDGRAIDPSRACRTIGGAINSPYYQPGTQILVSAGTYLEDNPLIMKPYTSVRGSDIRTTFIEPINKTQDLFHMQSGCYLNYMTFLNGRSGLLEGQYLPELNRGAYATAFPPLEGDEKIDLFHSPYIQNCTNQSGPWLKDGTMFIPNQTVQVPAAIGTGTWKANTTTIIVAVGTGTIEQGMYVNAGQQNQGFFNARTLLLANKPFIQEQVIAYVDQTFNSGSFVYDIDKCRRDTSLIIDSIALDMQQDSNSESIFAGLQYWRQSGYVDAIGNQITTTTNAITYLRNIATATLATSSTKSIVYNRFNDILEILNTSSASLSTGAFAEWITNKIVSNGTASTTASIVTAYNTLLASKTTLTNQTISYINSTLSPFVYDSTKCSRDTGLIVDSIVLDILFEGESQSNFAGIQYWNQSGLIGDITNELTTTTNTFNYLKSLAQKVIVNDTSGIRYQSTISQVVLTSGGTASEQTKINTEYNLIVTILNSGTTGVSDLIVPNGISASSSTSIVNAYNLLAQNRGYMIAEAIAFVESTKSPGFVYSQTKCARDVGYILDSVAFDLLYGGNKQAIQSGVYYYSYNASSTAIPGEIAQTVAAYNYMKELFSNVVRGIPITTSTLYQSTITQVVSFPAGSYVESSKAEELIDNIINIIKNGPNNVVKEPISLVRSENEATIAGAALLNSNRNFIRAEVVAYVNTLKAFIYDEETCRRDIGYILDSVAFDLLTGGNKQSIKSGVYYFGYTTTATEVPNEIPQVVAAYKYIKSIVSDVVRAKPILTKYQTTITQVTNLTSATNYEADTLKEKIDLITEIIRVGPTDYQEPGRRIPINLTKNTSTNVANAHALLLANKEFIKAEVISYINSTTNRFSYNREKCRRDVGIILENISYDAAFGGNEKSVQAGLAYYDGVVSLIAGQEVQTIAAIDYINSLAQKVIINTSCTNIIGSTSTYKQIVNTALTGGSIASDSINNLVDIITTIIDNGPSAAPDIYTSPGPDAAFIAAETLIQANRKFIQEDTINWINNTVQQFPYSEIKCRRDTGLILDAIAQDLKYPTVGRSQSTFAGLQYWNQGAYVGQIQIQLGPTLDAITYLRDLSVKIVQNITPADDLISRYQNVIAQNTTTYESATTNETDIITARFNEIIDIVNGNNLGWTDKFISNGYPSGITSIQNAYANLIANKAYLAAEVNAYVTATNFGFVYDAVKCARDVGYMVDAVAFDMLHGGNRQSIQNGLYYYGFSTTATNIPNEISQTVAAFNTLSNLVSQVIRGIPVTPRQTLVSQVFTNTTATVWEATAISVNVSTITNIITNGPSVAAAPSGIALTATSTATVLNAYDLIVLNKEFIVEEVIAFIDQTYNPTSFNYNEAKCYRDIGLILDAVSQDIILGGNNKSIEAGKAYWGANYNYIAGQETTTTYAINYARDLALQVIANREITPQYQTDTRQVINTFFQYGGDYMPQEAVKRNFRIITDIIVNGVDAAPPVFAGGGLFSLTGLNGADVLPAAEVVSVQSLGSGTFKVGLDQPTIGFGTNATLYFGLTDPRPFTDSDVDTLSIQYTGTATTWNQRKLDPIGAMGGSLVDGGVISDRSPIQSFVYDAFTQLNQGGIGMRITRNGYAQLVSVFTIFCSVGVQVDNGGIASITNSNCNFGDVSLLAKGYGRRDFSGTVFNPTFRAYPFSPTGVTGSNELDQYYPNGYWPNAGKVEIFCPDILNRPHISLVMEVEPPDGHLNEQNFPGFLNSQPSTSTLVTATITLVNIDTTDIAIGNTLYIRDQFGRQYDDNGIYYADTGTVVTDLGYNSIILNKALTSGGGDPTNSNYFTLYFCGNAYYTVLSSTVANTPYYPNQNILDPVPIGVEPLLYENPTVSQVVYHAKAIEYLQSITSKVVSNTAFTATNTVTDQIILPLVTGGVQSQAFIDLRFGIIRSILTATNITAAQSVVPSGVISKTGTVVPGAGSAVTLIEANYDFFADEVSNYVFTDSFFSPLISGLTIDEKDYIETKCKRDIKLIMRQIVYDLQSGGTYNSVQSGLSYWGRSGTHHIVELGEAVTRTDLFPDGSIVNFYQRSYISASGYLFEYVGAGTNYGALPQVGRADPVQGKETVQLDGGKVFFTSTDQNGDFRIGKGLVISQATGVLSGRTFVQSLYANMTPFILAIEG